MAVDTSPAESARSLLNGIDYSALIGGPLQAAITAQAMAAKSTWEYIQQVGLNTDKDGNRSAVNVSFMYQRDGEMVKLIVPILTIVPIPLIVVDEISIDFTANINASASSSSESSKAQDIGAELGVSGSGRFGAFSVSASLKASYSSKQSSKATQDSRYSVEYTQVVKVHARQADMPAGLSTVLNILSSAATGGTLHGQVTVSPTVASIDSTTKQLLQITTKDSNGLNVSADVTIAMNAVFKDNVALFDQLSGKSIGWMASTDVVTATVTTNASGNFAVNVGLTSKPMPSTDAVPQLGFTATMKGSREKPMASVPIKVAGAVAAAAVTFDPGSVDFVGKAPKEVKLVGRMPNAPNAPVKIGPAPGFAFTDGSKPISDLKLDDKGQGKVTITPTDPPPASSSQIPFTISLAGQDTTVQLNCTWKAQTGPAPNPAPNLPGLDARPETSRQAWTVTMQDAEGLDPSTPVYVQFDPTILRVRHDGDILIPGQILQLDDERAARLEIEVLAGAAAGEYEVVVEAATEDGERLRRVIPIRVGQPE